MAACFVRCIAAAPHRPRSVVPRALQGFGDECVLVFFSFRFHKIWRRFCSLRHCTPTFVAPRCLPLQGFGETHPHNPKVVSDMTSLHHIHEASILYNLRIRAAVDNQRPYTFMVRNRREPLTPVWPRLCLAILVCVAGTFFLITRACTWCHEQGAVAVLPPFLLPCRQWA